MKALYLADKTLQYREDYPQPEPGPGEALIRVRLAGICSTDLEMKKGYVSSFRGVPGHEFVGEVVDAPEPGWQGKRVVGEINLGCGECAMCRRGVAEHCAERRVLGIRDKDGVFAEYVTLPLENLFVAPERVTDETAVFTEPLAAALRIREQARVRPSAKTAVLGPGRLGLLVGQVLALAGTDVVMLGRRAASLDLPARLGLSAGLSDNYPDHSFDFVVDVTGNPAGFKQALRLTRPLGTLIIKSTFADAALLNPSPVVVNEITLIGSRCGPFAPALRLLARDQIAVAPLIDAAYPLHKGEDAFAHAAQSGVRKILLQPGEKS
jgi:threonine dehydrogenase-like Zn-dependent dehydrogenase